ncbi:hypothetical protein CHS0354_024039 [Potamilus streckersoni]|uniref:Triosephosphate isomerase n=1 Tax=Potamilus streckersoni TaxID=2493646 RepID=A0AAE0RZF4_9BIVA|nr:hypothetical protein CHS0354_024039 [Potamilus streckersoni]
MNLTLSESTSLAKLIYDGVASSSELSDAGMVIGIAPDFVSLLSVKQVVSLPILVGSQNVFYEEKGAFTGETSLNMLLSVGCDFVIVGHSERRHIFYESDDVINKKIKVSSSRLKSILCVGETLPERKEEKTNEIIEKQILNNLHAFPIKNIHNLIVAYEPVWAIGTNITPTPKQAEDVHLLIRQILANMFSKPVASNIPIIYGGSVNANNVKSLLSMPNIDGALVGGASLKAGEFLEIIRTASLLCKKTGE